MIDPITIDDIRKTGLCVSGARRWFGAHGLDFNAFLKTGLPAQTLLATGDEMAKRVVAKKQQRESSHG